MYQEAVREVVHSTIVPETVFYITGGGSEAIPLLMRHGGGSAFMVDAQIPYDPTCLRELLGGHCPDKYCSADTSRKLAVCAYERAEKLAAGPFPLGVGATCKLRKAEHEREGRAHEVYVSLHTGQRTYTHSVVLSERRTREQEERIAAQLICKAFFSFLGVRAASPAITLEELGCVDDVVTELSLENEYHVRVMPFQEAKMAHPREAFMPTIFPGSFNPMHDGHMRVIRHAAKITHRPVWLELSLTNCSKPTMDWVSLQKRLESIEKYKQEEALAGVILTRRPLFVDKLRLFFNPTFVVGSDTMCRIDDRSFYDSRQDYIDSVNEFVLQHSQFLVFVRKGDKVPETYRHKGLQDIVTVVGDVIDEGESSTKIRNEE
jgi:nicotinic acid mononucleotide adenylyltransferase